MRGQIPLALKGRPARPTKTPFVGPVIVDHQEVGHVTHYEPQAAHFARNGQKATAQLVRSLTRRGLAFSPHRIRGVRGSTEAVIVTITVTTDQTGRVSYSRAIYGNTTVEGAEKALPTS